jgi:hypothetical protein
LKKEYWVRFVTSDGVIASGEEFTWVKSLPSRNTPKYWKMVVNCQQIVLDYLKNIGKDRGAVSSIPAYFYFLAKDEFQIKILPVTKNHEEYVLVKLGRALEGLPVACLQTCQSCKRIFFNPSRFNARKRREADREGYNERQREIMRRKYERDAKKKAPNVKIARRKNKDTAVEK